MPAKSSTLSRWLLRAGTAALVLAAVGGAPVSAQTAASYLAPIPPQQARIWFYRDHSPYSSQARPYLRLNGVAIAISEPGGSFYRDVPPGHYRIIADSYLDAADQILDVDLLPGQQVFAKVLPDDSWINTGGAGVNGGYHRNTFYVWSMPPQTASREMAQTWFYGGGPTALSSVQ